MKAIFGEESCGDRQMARLVLSLAGVGLGVVLLRALRLGAVAGWQGFKVLSATGAPRKRGEVRPEAAKKL